jgi:uroporphyrinogen III methyltransferase/synthase
MTALTGKRILVTRPRAQAADLCDKLVALGAEPILFPTIEIAPLEDYAALDQAINELSQYHWVIFTSANGVTAFWDRLALAGKEASAFDGIRVAAIGPATARALQNDGVTPRFIPGEYVAEAITEGIGEVQGQRILLPRADIAREALADGLRAMGAVVDEVATYRTILADAQGPLTQHTRPMLQAGRIDAITFTSSSTVHGFVNAIHLDTRIKNLKPEIVIACIGPITAQTARGLGLPVDVMAAEYTTDGLVAALARHFEEKR